MALPRNDHEVDLWIEALAEFIDDGDFEHAMHAIGELTTYFVLLNLSKESCDGKAQAGFSQVRAAQSGRPTSLR